MTSKPGVLLVTTSPLLPRNAGGRIYTWGTTAPLADRFDYHLIALATPDERAEFEADRVALEAEYATVFRSVQLFDRPEIPGHMPRRRDVLRHLGFHTRHGLPLMDVSYYSPEVVAAADRMVREGAVDVIEVDHAQMAYVRKFVDGVPAILVNHNIEGDLHPFWMTDRWSLPELVVWRAFASISRRNTRRVEIRNAYGFAAKLFISPVDLDRVRPDCPNFLLPVPVDVAVEPHLFVEGRLRLLWLGGFEWPPNLEGVRWFFERVWPFLETDPRIEVDVVGANPPPDVEARATDRVRIHGYLDDLTEVTGAADALIAPLLSGSGVRVKVVEAMGRGLPVVATPKGLEGLTARSGRDLLVAARPDSFADEVLKLAGSVDLRAALSRNARAYVERTHAPERVSLAKAGALEAAIASAHPGR